MLVKQVVHLLGQHLHRVKVVQLRYQLKIVILIQFWQSTPSAVAQGGNHLKKSQVMITAEQMAKIVRLFSRFQKILFISSQWMVLQVKAVPFN